MRRIENLPLLLGAAGLLIAALGWVLDAGRFFGGWLAAVTVFSAWPLGSIALLLAHALTGGRWGVVIRPALRLGICSLPLLLPAMLLLLAGLTPLYPWARTHAAPNQFYLNVPFFAARLLFYLVVWSALGWLTLNGRGLARIAPIGLFLLAVTASFAAIDETMSLDPHFTSSIHGMIAAAQMGLLALSMAVLRTVGSAAPEERADLAKLLLALVILGTYLDFMRLLIVWQSDLPQEAPWYLQRFRGNWGMLAMLLVLCQFVVPFFLLLSRRLQRSRSVVAAVAAMLVASAILRGWWTVLPSLGRSVGWIDVACMAGLLGCAIALAPWATRHATPAPRFSHG
jgi:hypothetical protein